MIVHTIDLRESGPDGLIAVLEAHDFPRAEEVEAIRWETALTECFVDGCSRDARSEIVIHRRHSRRLREAAYLCGRHLQDHRDGEALRLRVESNR